MTDMSAGDVSYWVFWSTFHTFAQKRMDAQDVFLKMTLINKKYINK